MPQPDGPDLATKRYNKLKQEYDQLLEAYNDLRRQIIRDVEGVLQAAAEGDEFSDEARARVREAFEELRSTPPKSPEKVTRIESAPRLRKFKHPGDEPK